MGLKLYDYWRSSASYRLRIALHLKGVAFEAVQIDLHPKVKQHMSAAYRALTPQMRVPAIEVDGQVFAQSTAILEWIEETWPDPSLLPKDPLERLKVRGFAHTITSDVHPLNNPSVLNRLRTEFGADPDAISRWYSDWIRRAFAPLEQTANDTTGDFLFGDGPGMAEICLVPQLYNARRFDVDVSDFPRLLSVDAACRALPAFQAAAPEASRPVTAS